MVIREKINDDLEVMTSFNGREFISTVYIGDTFSVGFVIAENGTVKHNLKSLSLFEIYASAINSTSFASRMINCFTSLPKIMVVTRSFNTLVARSFTITDDLAIEE